MDRVIAPGSVGCGRGIRDEISPNLPEVVEVLRSQGITRIDLCSVGNVNILDLDDRRLNETARMLAGERFDVAAIATLIGKTPVDPVGAERVRFERALDVAIRLSAKCISVFTGCGLDNTWRSEADRDASSDEISHRIADKGAGAARHRLTLLVENDSAPFAESPHRMPALLCNAKSDTVTTAFDAVN
jgi:sugar phosphate isomerase/epimerase